MFEFANIRLLPDLRFLCVLPTFHVHYPSFLLLLLHSSLFSINSLNIYNLLKRHFFCSCIIKILLFSSYYITFHLLSPQLNPIHNLCTGTHHDYRQFLVSAWTDSGEHLRKSKRNKDTN